MVTESYVLLETAKLLKEKGFEGECHTFYEVNDKGKFLIASEVEKAARVDYGDREEYQRPTLQVAMKWLREIHKIDIIPFHEKLPNDCYWCRIERHPYTEFEQEPVHENQDQACEAAIRYCLQNLI